MLCPLHYTLSGANGDQISMDKVDSCLRELALHGKEEFNKWSGIIISASKNKLDYVPVCATYRVNHEKATSTELFF
jgi:hypothetical protein